MSILFENNFFRTNWWGGGDKNWKELDHLDDASDLNKLILTNSNLVRHKFLLKIAIKHTPMAMFDSGGWLWLIYLIRFDFSPLSLFLFLSIPLSLSLSLSFSFPSSSSSPLFLILFANLPPPLRLRLSSTFFRSRAPRRARIKSRVVCREFPTGSGRARGTSLPPEIRAESTLSVHSVCSSVMSNLKPVQLLAGQW